MTPRQARRERTRQWAEGAQQGRVIVVGNGDTMLLCPTVEMVALKMAEYRAAGFMPRLATVNPVNHD